MIARTLSILTMALVVCALLLTSAPAQAGDRFTDNGDGTVSDHDLGLMWSKADNQGDVNWHDARRWVKYTFPTTVGAAHDDWRLPTVEELTSLFKESAYYQGYESDCGLNVKVDRAFALSCAFVWTSEARSVTARLYNFQLGHTYMDRKAKTRGFRALAVRDLDKAAD